MRHLLRRTTRFFPHCFSPWNTFTELVEEWLPKVIKTSRLISRWTEIFSINKPLPVLSNCVQKFCCIESLSLVQSIETFSHFLRNFLTLSFQLTEPSSEIEWPVFNNYFQKKFKSAPLLRPSHLPTVSVWAGKEQISHLIELALRAASSDAQRKFNPEISSFIPYSNQGLVLRNGHIFETIKGANPSFSSSTHSSPETKHFLDSLRQLLPFGTTQHGMLLIRITNFPHLPVSSVSNSELSTPWHTDKAKYGGVVFSTCLVGSSALLFAHKDESGRVCVAAPDSPGFLWVWQGTLMSDPFVHCVPNSRSARISITWRPFTCNDPSPPQTSTPSSPPVPHINIAV